MEVLGVSRCGRKKKSSEEEEARQRERGAAGPDAKGTPASPETTRIPPAFGVGASDDFSSLELNVPGKAHVGPRAKRHLSL